MTDKIPDRLSVNPKSPYYDEDLLEHDVGVRFKGEEKTNVEEYCISEGWVRVAIDAAPCFFYLSSLLRERAGRLFTFTIPPCHGGQKNFRNGYS